MRTLTVLLPLVALPALAQAEDCATVRRTLQLAQSFNVDAGELWRLERRVCAPPSQQGASGETCHQLDALWVLAMAAGEPDETASALEAQRGVWCGRGDEPRGPLQWPDGSTLRSSSGTLYWRNGMTARSTSGTWHVSSGAVVRSPSGSLSYPSGSQARTSSGRTMLPNGDFADEGRIAALACAADPSWCRYFLDVARSSSGVRREFAFIGLGRLAGRAR
jgi:hypothetical protein